MVGFLALFFFIYVGMEVTLGVYLTTFAVECKLALTKVTGANLTAIYWGTFAAMRLVAIFAAMKLNPSVIMLFSFVLSFSAAVTLSIWGEVGMNKDKKAGPTS